VVGGSTFTCSDLSACHPSSLSGICSTPPTPGQVLGYNGSEYCPSTIVFPSASSTLPTGSTGDILVVGEGDSAFGAAVASGDLFNQGIAAKSIATFGANANFTEDLQRDSKDVLVDPTGGTVGDVVRKGASAGTVTYTGPGDFVSGAGFLPSSITETRYATAAQGATADAAMPKTGGAFTGAVTTNSTIDGVDIATRDGVLTSTTNTANNAIPNQSGSAGDVLIIPEGGSNFSSKIASGTFFDAGISVKQIATVTSGATTNFPNGIQSGGSDLATEAELLSVSNALLPSSVAGSNEIYYKNGATPDGLATTTGSRAFISSDANFDDITNVTLTGDTKAQLVLRTGDFITASSLNEGAINMLFGTAGDGAGEIDFTPSGSGGGSTLVSENISGTNVSADSLAVANNITVGGTVDGVDIASRDSTLTSTTTTANNALPKAGGTMTGNFFLSGNLNAPYTSLANAGIATTLHREVGAPVASSNSTSLAEVASYTLPANVLTLGDIDIMIRGRQLAQGSNLRWNFKIAGTNILNSSISQGTYSDFTRYTMHIQISKMETDRQMVTARFVQGTGTGSAAGFSGWSSTHRDGIVHNEATGDESGTLALSLEAQQSDAAQTVSVDQFTVKLIPNPFA
jgi:hypothetical protein